MADALSAKVCFLARVITNLCTHVQAECCISRHGVAAWQMAKAVHALHNDSKSCVIGTTKPPRSSQDYGKPKAVGCAQTRAACSSPKPAVLLILQAKQPFWSSGKAEARRAAMMLKAAVVVT